MEAKITKLEEQLTSVTDQLESMQRNFMMLQSHMQMMQQHQMYMHNPHPPQMYMPHDWEVEDENLFQSPDVIEIDNEQLGLEPKLDSLVARSVANLRLSNYKPKPSKMQLSDYLNPAESKNL